MNWCGIDTLTQRNRQCPAVLSNHVSTEVHDCCSSACIIILMPTECAWQKRQAFFKIAWMWIMMAVQVPASCLWSQKKKGVLSRKAEKRTVLPHFPSFFQPLCLSVNLLSLDETQRLLRRKAPELLRLPHTDLFTGAGRWSHKPDARSPLVCVCVCERKPPPHVIYGFFFPHQTRKECDHHTKQNPI